MSSGEQRMQEQFEASGLRSRPQHLHSFLWEGFRGGYRARDAEVQKLREALLNMVAVFLPVGEREADAHERAFMLLAEYLPEESADAD